MLFHTLNLIRIKDWLKNLLILVPLIFSNNLLSKEYYLELVFTFLLFSMVSSVIYILNDIKDIETDQLHSVKKNSKPLANNQLTVFFAKKLMALLITIIVLFLLYNSTILSFILYYVILNLFYNYFLKNIPIIDILIISVGYILRIESGSEVIDVDTSLLMICSIFFLSSFIVSIKRKKEFENNFLSRASLKFYNLNFLTLFSYLSCLAAFGFYLFYIITKNSSLIISTPIVFFVFLRYLYITHNTEKGEFPIDTVIKDFQLLLSCIIYVTIVIYSFL